jgi:glycosyltransferase involved in cell wall biosynthesis
MSEIFFKSKKVVDATCLMAIYKNDKPDWVDEALLSILNGTVMPSQILVYCDGWVDPAIHDLLDEYSQNFSNLITVFSSHINKGRAFSRQFLLNKAKGKYIFLMDADDISLPNRLELQYGYANSNPDLDLLGGHIVEFSRGFCDRIRKVPLMNVEIRGMIKYAQPLNHVTLFGKKNALESIGGYIEAGNCEDFFLIARAVVSGLNIQNIDQVLVRVRVDENFVYRRRGLRIALDEVRVIMFLCKSKYINLFEFFLYAMYRFTLRIMPSVIIKKLYSLSRTKI